MSTIDLSTLLLPSDLLEHFRVLEVLELGDCHTKQMIYQINLEEKNRLPQIYNREDYESKGFYSEKMVQDFPVRGKALYLCIKRRRWRLKQDKSITIKSDYSFISEGSKLTSELSDFLKGIGRYSRRYDK